MERSESLFDRAQNGLDIFGEDRRLIRPLQVVHIGLHRPGELHSPAVFPLLRHTHCMILAVAIGTSVLAGFIGLPYTWYRYHLAWVGWLRVLLVFFLTAVANAALAVVGRPGVHASGKHHRGLLPASHWA